MLTQLAQLEVSFGDFTRIGVSRVNRLAVGEGRFERVVATLGIFFLGGSGCDGACICATRFAGRTARFTVTGAWFAVFVSGGASFSRRWRVGELDERGRIEARTLARQLISAPEQAQLFKDGSEDLTVPVRLKGIRIERSRQFGDVYLALALCPCTETPVKQ
jgi:hypothetical protein